MGGVEANQGEPCVSSANGPKGDNLASSTYTLNDCADCDGRGYIAVHDIKNPYVPAQAQCAKCCGSGKVANSPSALIQKLKDEYYIPADIGHKTSYNEAIDDAIAIVREYQSCEIPVNKPILCPICGGDLDGRESDGCKPKEAPLDDKHFGEKLNPLESKAYDKWVKNAGDNPLIMANCGFETFLAGWQAGQTKSPKRESGYQVTEEQLGKVYHANFENEFSIAILCDEHIDKSGALLGRVRNYKPEIEGGK